MKNIVFWDVRPSGFCKKRRFGATYHLYHQTIIHRVLRLLVIANVVLSSPIIVILMIEALSSSETLVLTRDTRRNISEDDTIHSHRREEL
jgi:hypothetical protein